MYSKWFEVTGLPTQPNFVQSNLHFRFFGQLLEVERRIDGADGQTIGFGNIVNLIGGDHRRGAGHVLDNDVRISGNVFRHELGKHARIKIVSVARFGADDDRDGFALVEGRLRLRRSCGQQKNRKEKASDLSLLRKPPEIR